MQTATKTRPPRWVRHYDPDERARLQLLADEQHAADLLTSDPEAQPCGNAPTLHFDAYQLKGPYSRRASWWKRWNHPDRWWRGWQGEWEVIYGITRDACASCPRAWTRAGAIRKSKRWYRRGTDVGRSRRARPWPERRSEA